jgi:hypothetical protein
MKIAFQREDGQVCILHAVSKDVLEDDLGQMTQEEYEMRIWQDVPSEYAETARIITEDEIPTDRTFRDAWAFDFSVDMEKARAIHMDKIREARAEKFIKMGFPSKLDEEVEAAFISAKKREALQVLRDLPQTLNLSGAATPEELKAIWPKELEGI